jgi:hypothetical protein
MASGDTKTQQYLGIAANGTRADIQRGCCDTRTQTLIMDVAERIITEEENREAADDAIQDEIDEIKNSPDVVDIVATYADLENYDTSTLTDNDIIRVLQDETQDGASTFYRWNATTNQFDYIGQVGNYYTKSQTDILLGAKQDTLTAGDGITISGDTISVDIVQTPGTSTTSVLSQKAVDDNYIRNTVVAAFWHGTEAQYNAIATKDAKTLYLIEEE